MSEIRTVAQIIAQAQREGWPTPASGAANHEVDEERLTRPYVQQNKGPDKT